MSKKTKKGVQKKLGLSDSDSPGGKEINTDISREERAYNVAIIFSTILQDYFKQDADVLVENFYDIWSDNHFCRISGYDIECVMNSLRDLNVKVPDWELMIGFAEELKELREETKNLIFKIGELFKALSSRGLQVPSQESKEVSQMSSTNRAPSDFARVSVSVALPEYSGTKGHAAKWVRDFKSIVKTQRYGESQWDALLPTCLKKDALRFFNTK